MTADISTLFARWRKPILQWLKHRSSIPPADLDDIAQETFMRLLRYSDMELVDHPQSYVFRIAMNVAHEWRERARNRLPHDDAWLDDLVDEHQPDDDIDDPAIAAAIDKLPSRARTVLLMHVNDGRTYKQIAAAMGITNRQVMRDLTKSYSQLRGMLGCET